MRYEIRLSGMGGQGLLLAGIIVAEAAMAQGRNVVQTASYGPESRGGASRSEVIISDLEIDYPAVIEADLLFAMTQEAAERYMREVKPAGTAIFDSTWVKSIPSGDVANVYYYPLTERAIEKYQKPIFANVIGLGMICRASGAVEPSFLESALLERVPKRYQEANKLAFNLGIELFDSGRIFRGTPGSPVEAIALSEA